MPNDKPQTTTPRLTWKGVLVAPIAVPVWMLGSFCLWLCNMAAAGFNEWEKFLCKKQ
jgi:hypothetical protein